MDYTPLEKLVTTLQNQVKTLKAGNMKLDEVSTLVSSAREVYERLVVLEFQAFEKIAVPASTSEPKPFKIETSSTENVVEAAVEEVSIKIEAPSELEVIEEVVQEAIKEKEPVEEVKEPVVEEKKEEVKKSAPAVEEKKEEVKEKAPVENEPTESLAEKYEQAPIADIAKSISLNEKFQFIRVLCHNNAKNFEKLLEKVNSSANEKEALSTFFSLIPVPDSDDERDVYKKFEELIKRRF